MNEADLDNLAALVFQQLGWSRRGSVIAAWPDGRVSTHDLGFRDFRGRHCVQDEPLSMFVAGTDLSRDAVVRRLERGLLRRQRFVRS